MTDDEKRLLLAVAACLLADRVGVKTPDDAAQARVLRKFLYPFRDFMAADVANFPGSDAAEDYRSDEDASPKH